MSQIITINDTINSRILESMRSAVFSVNTIMMFFHDHPAVDLSIISAGLPAIESFPYSKTPSYDLLLLYEKVALSLKQPFAFDDIIVRAPPIQGLIILLVRERRHLASREIK